MPKRLISNSKNAERRNSCCMLRILGYFRTIFCFELGTTLTWAANVVKRLIFGVNNNRENNCENCNQENEDSDKC